MLITTLGTHPSPDGSWRIGVSEDSIDFARPAAGGGGISITAQPNGWRAQPGWFVFTESESRVWAYDGGSRLYLKAFSSSGSGMYYGIFRATNFDSNFPCAVPPEVISHLPEQKRKEIQNPVVPKPESSRSGGRVRKNQRMDKSALARECAKLDRKSEQAIADEGLATDISAWPK